MTRPIASLPMIRDTDWAHMSWQAKQQWLRAASRLRAELTADLTRRLANERARAEALRAFTPAEMREAIESARAILRALPPEPEGRDRLADAVREIRRHTDRKAAA